MIREAGLSDFAAVLALEVQVYNLHRDAHTGLIRSHMDEAIFRKYFEESVDNENGKIFIYEEDGAVLGYCVTRVRDLKDHRLFFDGIVLELDDICVDAGARGKRVGHSLFERAKAYAKEIGAARLELTVWEFNKNARKFFERQGMAPRMTRMEMNIDAVSPSARPAPDRPAEMPAANA